MMHALPARKCGRAIVLVIAVGTMLAASIAHGGSTELPPRGKRALLAWLNGTNSAFSFGRGLPVCTGCHQTGVDYLRSAFRP